MVQAGTPMTVNGDMPGKLHEETHGAFIFYILK